MLECRDAGGKFDLSVPLGDAELHLNVSVATAGDLLSATLIDIGEVKRREASFRLLFEHNPVPMWVCDPDALAILGVNDVAIDHYGYTRTQFLGMRLPDLWPGDIHVAGNLSPVQFRSLGIATTAEGVETAEQLERVRAEGCTEVQGYLFSAPRPASELVALLPFDEVTSAA